MLQVNVHGPHDVRLDSIAMPEPGPRDVVVDVEFCGICGSDLSYIAMGGTAKVGSAEPLPLGHEAAGTVSWVGENVSNLVPGTHVVINPRFVPLTIGNGASEGALTPRLLVRDAVVGESVVVIDHSVRLDHAAMVEPFAVAKHAVGRAVVGPDSRVVVFGLGQVGLAAIVWLRQIGVREIVAVDIEPESLRRADALGASAAVLTSSGDVAEMLIEVLGERDTPLGRACAGDVFFDFAGGGVVLERILDVAPVGATVVLVALYSEPLEIDLMSFVLRELTLISSLGYPTEFNEVAESLPIIADQIDMVISHRFPLAQFGDALATMRERGNGKILIHVAAEHPD